MNRLFYVSVQAGKACSASIHAGTGSMVASATHKKKNSISSARSRRLAELKAASENAPEEREHANRDPQWHGRTL